MLAPHEKLTVEFYSNCKAKVDTQTVAFGSKIVQPIQPIREGYTFLGWYLNGTKFDFSSAPTKSCTLIAHWEKNDKAFYPSDTSVVTFEGINAGLHVVWKDYADAKAVRPSEVTCILTQVYGNTKQIYEIILTKTNASWKDNSPSGAMLTQGAGGDWTLSIKNLPETVDSLPCSYTLRQKPLEGHYTTLQSGTAAINTLCGYIPSTDKTVKLTTRNSRLYDAAGNMIVFKGVVTYNIGLPSLDESVTPTALQRLSAIGCNAIRVSMQLIGRKGTASGYVWYSKPDGGRTGDYNDSNAERPSAEVKQKMIDKIGEVIAMATEAGLYVIIDWALFTSNPYQYLNEASEFFGILAEKHANNPYVLFEICNEPAKCSWGGDCGVKAYAEKIISLIREKGSDAVVILSPRGSAYYISIRSAGPTPGDDPIDDPLDDDTRYNVAYTFHNYPYVNAYAKFSWKLREAYESGLTIVSTEMSPMDATFDNRDNIAYDMDQMAMFIRTYQEWDMSFFFFRYGSTSGDYTEWLMLKPNIDPDAYAWTRDDLTECGKWYYDLVTGDGVFMSGVDYDSPRIPFEKQKFEDTHAEYGLGNVFPTFALSGTKQGSAYYFKVNDCDSLTDIQYESYCNRIWTRISKMENSVATQSNDAPFTAKHIPNQKTTPMALTYQYREKTYTVEISYTQNTDDLTWGILFNVK